MRLSAGVVSFPSSFRAGASNLLRNSMTSFAGIVLFLAVAPSCFGQSQIATLSGVVSDPHGAVISNAQITVVQSHAETSKSQHAISDGEGRFTFRLSPGTYRLTVDRDSFVSVSEDIPLAAGENNELHLRLALQALSSKVVVTAQALPVQAESSPAPVTVLTRADIEERAAISLPNLLATQPGFSLGRTGPEGGTASLFLDGGNSNYTKVLVDGAPINVPGGLIDFSNLTLDNVDKIEIVHGAESALYGSDAMDGVIQIFTRRGTTPVPVFTAFADGGNFSTGHGGAELSGLAARRLDYSAAVSDLETQGQGPNDAFRDRTLSAISGWKFSDDSKLELSVRDTGSKAGTPGQTLLVPANLDDSIALHNFDASLLANFTTGTHWTHQVLGTELYEREFNYDPYFPSLYQYNRAAGTAQSTYSYRGIAVTAGYEYEVENGFLTYIGSNARRNNQAGFLDVRWQPIGRLTVDAGGRIEDNTYYGIRGVPRAGASYVLRLAQGSVGDTRLHATYGLGIVEPRFDQAFGTDPCFPGDPNLSPEESRSIHAGFDQKLFSDRVRISVDYFDNRFHNIVSFGATTPSAACLAIGAPFGSGTYFNTDLARARGGEFATEARITRWLSADANYTYDPTRVLVAPNATDPAEIPGNRLLRRPVHSGNVDLNASFHRMNWNVSGYFTGRRTDSDFLGIGLTSNPGYARFDAGGSFNLYRGLSIYARAVNLANKQYQDALGYPALGREFRVGLKYTTGRE